MACGKRHGADAGQGSSLLDRYRPMSFAERTTHKTDIRDERNVVVIRTKRAIQTLEITITGPIRQPLAYDLTEALIGVAEDCSEYHLDLGAVTEISDGGLAVLVMFTSCAHRRGRVVRLTRISTALARRLAMMPILHPLLAPYDEAVRDTRPPILPAERQQRDIRGMRDSAANGYAMATTDTVTIPRLLRHGTLH